MIRLALMLRKVTYVSGTLSFDRTQKCTAAKDAVTNQIILLECDTQILRPILFWRSGASSEMQKAYIFLR